MKTIDQIYSLNGYVEAAGLSATHTFTVSHPEQHVIQDLTKKSSSQLAPLSLKRSLDAMLKVRATYIELSDHITTALISVTM